MSTETTPATSSETEKMLSLITSDFEKFEIEETVALQSQTIKGMIEDNCADSTIPLPNVTGAIFAKVIEYCKKHALQPKQDSDKSDDLEKWDEHYIGELDRDKLLFHVIMAANYLEIKGLLDLSCQKVADSIKGYKPDKIRKLLNITIDRTPEEEKKIREENAWAFE